MVKLSQEGFDLLKLAWNDDSESLKSRIAMGYKEMGMLRDKARELTDNHSKLYDREHDCPQQDELEDTVPFQYDCLNDVWNIPNESDYAGTDDVPYRYIIFCCPYCGQKLPVDEGA